MAQEIISGIFGNIFILLSCVIGFAFGIWNLYKVKNFKITNLIIFLGFIN
jgi:hypothetical protein